MLSKAVKNKLFLITYRFMSLIFARQFKKNFISTFFPRLCLLLDQHLPLPPPPLQSQYPIFPQNPPSPLPVVPSPHRRWFSPLPYSFNRSLFVMIFCFGSNKSGRFKTSNLDWKEQFRIREPCLLLETGNFKYKCQNFRIWYHCAAFADWTDHLKSWTNQRHQTLNVAFLKNWPVKVLGGSYLSVWGPRFPPPIPLHTVWIRTPHKRGGGG